MRTHLENNNQVAHYWANKVQERGEGSHFYFEGDTIYSYGGHFPIAKHVEKKGKQFVLFTTQGYSVTTSQHISLAMRASSHLNQINVRNIQALSKEDHLDNVKEGLSEIGNLLLKAKRARTHSEVYQSDALQIAVEMKMYTSVYLPRHKFNFDDIDSLRDKAEALGKKEQARQRKETLERLREAEKDINAWKKGQTDSVSWVVDKVFLRVKGDNVQTSHHADVPIEEAVTFFALCRACRTRSKGMKAFSHKIGVYTPSSIDSKGNAVIGCHKLDYEEMERLNKELEAHKTSKAA